MLGAKIFSVFIFFLSTLALAEDSATVEKNHTKPKHITEKYIDSIEKAKTKSGSYQYNHDKTFNNLSKDYRGLSNKERKKVYKHLKDRVNNFKKPETDEDKEVQRGVITQYEAFKAIRRNTDLKHQKNIPVGKIKGGYIKNVERHLEKYNKSQ